MLIKFPAISMIDLIPLGMNRLWRSVSVIGYCAVDRNETNILMGQI